MALPSNVVTFNEDGQIVRSNVIETDFFVKACNHLKSIGFEPTVWVDYFHKVIGDNHYFVTVKRNNVIVTSQDGFMFSTKKLNRLTGIGS